MDAELSPATDSESPSPDPAPAVKASVRPVSKWKRAYESHRKYQKSWEDRFGWVTQAIDGSESAYCRYCFKVLLPRVACLSKHETSTKHQSKAAKIAGTASSSQRYIPPAVASQHSTLVASSSGSPEPSVDAELFDDDMVDGPFRPDADFLNREPIADFSNLVNLDAKDIMEVASAKILDRYTVWDLLLEKARLGVQEDVPGIVTIMSELGQMHRELKRMIVSCMAPMPSNRTGRASDPTVDVDPGLATALDIPPGRYKQLPLAQISYDCVLDPKQLFRDSKGVVSIKPAPDFITNDLDEEETDDSEQEPEPVKRKPGRPRKGAPPKRGRKRKKRSVSVNSDEIDALDFPAETGTKCHLDEDSSDPELDDDESDEDFVPGQPLRKRPPLQRVTRKTATVKRATKLEPATKKTHSEPVLEKDFSCKSCGKPFAKASWCASHENSCRTTGRGLTPASGRGRFRKVEGGGFTCNLIGCDRDVRYANRRDVESHILNVHVTDADKTIACPLCEERFALTSTLQAHMHLSHERLHECDTCRRTFFTFDELDSHVVRTHNDDNRVDGAAVAAGVASSTDNTVPCLKCGRLMAEHSVKQHEAKCSGLTIRRPEYKQVGGEFVCTVSGCDVAHGFSSRYGLRAHFHAAHVTDDERVFPCLYCGQRFSFNTARNLHVRAVHLKIHQCQFCSMRFGSKDKLRGHVRTHTGEKPFACDECAFRAAKKSNLVEHRRKLHADPGNGQFACGACGKRFATMARARKHIALSHEAAADGPYPAEGGFHEDQQLHPAQDQQLQAHVMVAAAHDHHVLPEEQELAVEFITADLQIQHQEVVF